MNVSGGGLGGDGEDVVADVVLAKGSAFVGGGDRELGAAPALNIVNVKDRMRGK